MDHVEITNTLQQHLNQPDISPAKYVRSRHLELAESIADRHKIYLDTRYWLLFRDVVLGRRTDESLIALLDYVRNAVQSGRAICPVSQDSFSEVFVQNDPETLASTTELMDELSGGVCQTEFFTRLDAELYHFMVQKTKGYAAVHDRDQLMWTKCGYVLGYVSPQNDAFTMEQSDAIEKAFFDQVWTATFNDMFAHLGCCPDWKVDPSSVDDMNVGKFAHNGEFNSFKQLFMIELAGALDLLQNSLSEIMFQMYLTEFGDKADPNAKPDPATGKMAANLVYHAFRLNKLNDELPTLRTHVTLHAALRWHKNRKYKPNDLTDLRHAAMALPYCDTFLTEGPLCHLIHEKHLGLTDRFKCQTFADPELALQHVREMGV